MHAKDLGLSPPDHVLIHLRGMIGLLFSTHSLFFFGSYPVGIPIVLDTS